MYHESAAHGCGADMVVFEKQDKGKRLKDKGQELAVGS
jgi:hypothetical protein